MKNKKTPLVSVVMLNWNGLEYLKKTIPSILELNYPNCEFIIVDNNSSDKSQDYIKRFKQIKLIETKENLGYSKGKNIGVNSCKGKYVLLLDNDILIKNKDLLKNLLLKNIEDEIVTFVINNLGENKTIYYGGYFDFYGIKENKKINLRRIIKYKNSFNCAFPHGGAIFFKKDFWVREFQGYDERQPYMLDDHDLGMRAWIFKKKCVVYNEGNYLVHLGKDNSKNNEYHRWRFKYYFSGLGTSFLKNSHFSNAFRILPFLLTFTILKAIKQFAKRGDIKIILSLCQSISFFLKSIPVTLIKRKEIQARRKIEQDIFLEIKAPKFY